MNNLTIILIYRNSKEDKKENLLFSLDYYKRTFVKSEILVVEQDILQSYKDSIFCYNGGLFNRSWAFNVGMCLANKEIVERWIKELGI